MCTGMIVFQKIGKILHKVTLKHQHMTAIALDRMEHMRRIGRHKHRGSCGDGIAAAVDLHRENAFVYKNNFHAAVQMQHAFHIFMPF